MTRRLSALCFFVLGQAVIAALAPPLAAAPALISFFAGGLLLVREPG